MQKIPAAFYDKSYFTDGSKSNYAPYGPGDWADALARMIVQYDDPESVLDVGCATGFVVDRLNTLGVKAQGFDISDWAIDNAVCDQVWVGSADDPTSYVAADLITAIEMPEHLTPEQAHDMFVYSLEHANRMLCLIAAFRDGEDDHFDPQHEKDLSHINIKPLSWWRALAETNRWHVIDSTKFDSDPKSIEMGWDGRFLRLGKQDWI